jgi:hypothetical protein
MGWWTPPPLPAGIPAIQKLAASATHFLLYVTLVIQPILGWIATSAYRAPITVYGLFELPPIWRENRGLSEQVFFVHRNIGIIMAVLIGVPLNGVDPRLSHLGTKSGSRKVFREAGVDLPLGTEDVRTEHDVVNALQDLRAKRPGLRRAVVKLNDSFSGEGNAIFRFPSEVTGDALHDELRALEFAVSAETPVLYFEKLGRMGGIVEEFIDAPEKHSPSSQLRLSPTGEIMAISTHDQILGGPSGQVFLGCSFPAADGYRLAIQEAGIAIGEVLARHGVVSRLAIDYLVHRQGPEEDWKVTALEINLRMGGTTHPFLALRFLTGGQLDPTTGLFRSPNGTAKYYRATDNLRSEAYRGLLPEDLIDIVTVNRLHYDHVSETGVLFHLMGALSQFGKVGLTAIGNTPAQAEELYARTVTVLDRETIYGH